MRSFLRSHNILFLKATIQSMEFLSANNCTLATPLEITRNHNYTRSLVLLVGKLLGAHLSSRSYTSTSIRCNSIRAPYGSSTTIINNILIMPSSWLAECFGNLEVSPPITRLIVFTDGQADGLTWRNAELQPTRVIHMWETPLAKVPWLIYDQVWSLMTTTISIDNDATSDSGQYHHYHW